MSKLYNLLVKMEKLDCEYSYNKEYAEKHFKPKQKYTITDIFGLIFSMFFIFIIKIGEITLKIFRSLNFTVAKNDKN